MLVAEDEYLIMSSIVDELRDQGAVIAGPVAIVKDALDIVKENTELSGAVLDINLHGDLAFPVADALADRGVPFVFASGCDESVIPDRHANVTICPKPQNPVDVLIALLT